MKIEEIGNESSRAAEVRRMAQSMAAERLASAQASGVPGVSNSANGSSIQEDSIKLSSQALSQVSNRNGAASMQYRGQLQSSLMEKLEAEILNPNSDFNNQKTKKGGSGGGGGKKKIKRKTEWQPTAKEGQIHHGREVIGKIRVTTEVKEESGGSGASAKIAGSGRQQKAAEDKPQAGEVENATGTSKVGQKPAMAAGASSGQASGGGSGSGGGKVEEFDVKGRAFGATQTLTMLPAKELKPDDKSLGTFRKLDDKPMLKYVTTHSRDTKQAAGELKKNALAAGETPDAVRRALQMLKDRSAGEKTKG